MTPNRTAGAALLRAAARIIAAVVTLGLAGCSSSKGPKRSEFGPTYKERMAVMNKIMKNQDFSMRSSFDKEISKSTTERSYKAPAFSAKDASGMKQFSGKDGAFHTKDFAGAGKQSATEQKVARETQEQNKLASRMFRTPDSRFDAKVSHDDEKTFNRGDETFATHENRTGTKEMEKNKKPVMLDHGKSTYSEDEVKRLLNKG